MLQTNPIEHETPVYTRRKPQMTADESQMLKDCLSQISEARCKASFSKLFKWFAPKIIRFGIKQLGSETVANELLQETMSKVWRKAHLYDNTKGAATTWVYTVMRNVSFDMLRKVQSNREDTLSDDIWPMVEEGSSSENDFDDHLMSKQMSNYLDHLPEAQRQVVKGMYFQELSQEELAVQLNIPIGTVKSRLRLGLNKLKQKIGEDS